MTMRHQAVTLVFFKYIKLGYNVLLTTTRTVEMMMMAADEEDTGHTQWQWAGHAGSTKWQTWHL